MDTSAEKLQKELNEEMNEAFCRFTERKWKKDDPGRVARDKLLDLGRDGEIDKNAFLDAVSDFQYEIELEAFDAGLLACFDILNSHISNK